MDRFRTDMTPPGPAAETFRTVLAGMPVEIEADADLEFQVFDRDGNPVALTEQMYDMAEAFVAYTALRPSEAEVRAAWAAPVEVPALAAG